MFGPGTFFGDLIKTIAGNKLYLVIVTAICTALVMPLIRYIAKNIWEGLNKLFTKLSRSRKFLEDYISWTIHTNKYISVLPTTMAAVKTGTLHLMELDEIYISLTMTRGADAGRSLSLEHIIRKNNRIIILGDPGAGKSTMMQYLTLRTAYNAARVKNKQTPFLGQRIPILIRLNKFHDIKDWPADKEFLSAIKTEIEINSCASIPEGFLEKKLKKGKCIILLDAFDELASKTARQFLSEKTKNLVARYPKNRFIVTSRITGYSNQFAGADFDNPYTIQHLTSDHIRTFIHKWYENLTRLQMADKAEDERSHFIMRYRQRANSLIDVILGNERIRQLAINPMLLSLISRVHYVMKLQLPDQRHMLYRECIEILVKNKIVQIPIIDRLNVKEKKQILQRIAWHMQENHLKSVSKIEVVKTVLTEACRGICGEKIKEDELDKFLDIIQERTGLLTEKGFNAVKLFI